MTRDVYCKRMGYFDCRAALWAALSLALFVFSCSAPPGERVSAVTGQALSPTCGWVQTECSPHASADVALRVTATGSVALLAEGDDPCEVEPTQALLVAPGAGWASWQRGEGEFTLWAAPVTP